MQKKKIVIGILLLLIVIQFFRIDKINPPIEESKDFIFNEHPPQKIAAILQKTCYDCHSNTTKYPWYTNVAPISWWVKNHINNGREHLNFSTYTDMNPNQQNHAIDECIEVLKDDRMPMKSYALLHSEAKLSNEDKTELIQYFKSLQNKQ